MPEVYLRIPELSQRVIDRFKKRVAAGDPDRCWIWLGQSDRSGYGYIQIKKRRYVVTRIAYAIASGHDPGDLGILHSCDNPSCVNPGHLRPGTQADNLNDARLRNRLPVGEARSNARLSEEKVRAIHAAYSTGDYSLSEVARMFGVSRGSVHDVVYLRGWRYLGLPSLAGIRAELSGGRGMVLSRARAARLNTEEVSGCLQ